MHKKMSIVSQLMELKNSYFWSDNNLVFMLLAAQRIFEGA